MSIWSKYLTTPTESPWAKYVPKTATAVATQANIPPQVTQPIQPSVSSQLPMSPQGVNYAWSQGTSLAESLLTKLKPDTVVPLEVSPLIIDPGDIGLPPMGTTALGGSYDRPSVELNFGVDSNTSSIVVLHNKKKIGTVDPETLEIKLDDPNYVFGQMTRYFERYHMMQEGLVPAEGFSGFYAKAENWLNTPKKVGDTTLPAPGAVLGAIGMVGSLVLGSIQAYPILKDYLAQRFAQPLSQLFGEVGAYKKYESTGLHTNLLNYAKQAGLSTESQTFKTLENELIRAFQLAQQGNTVRAQEIIDRIRSSFAIGGGVAPTRAVTPYVPTAAPIKPITVTPRVVPSITGGALAPTQAMAGLTTTGEAFAPTITGAVQAGVEFIPISTKVGNGYEILQNGESVGEISYATNFPGVDGIIIDRIDIVETARRQGLATQAINRVLSDAEASGVSLYTGMLEADGVKLFNALEERGIINLTPAPQRMLGQVVTRTPEYATTAMAEGETVTGKPTAEVPSGRIEVNFRGSSSKVSSALKAFQDAGFGRISALPTGTAHTYFAWIPNTPEARALLKKVGGTVSKTQPEFLSKIETEPPIQAISQAPAGMPEVTIPRGIRPDLYVADIEGMMPETAKKVKSVQLSDGSELVIMSAEGDIYGLIGGKEVGFAMKLSDTETDLSVAMEYRNKGIGTELLRQFRIENPGHPTGGLTEGGKRVIERLAREVKPTAGVPTTPPGMPEAVKPTATAVTPTAPSGTVPPTGVPPTTEAPPTAPTIPTTIPPTPPPTTPLDAALNRDNSFDGIMADLQDAEIVNQVNTRNDWVRKWVKKTPHFKGLSRLLNPQTTANTPAERAVMVLHVLYHESTQKTKGVMAYINELGKREEIFGKVDEKGFLTTGALRGKTLGDIAQQRGRWESQLTDEQKLWLDRAKVIEDSIIAFLRRNGIDINTLTVEQGGQFAGRRVWAKKLDDGTVIESAYIGAKPGRIGAKLPTERHRVFQTEAEAIAEGFYYVPYEQVLYLRVLGAYYRIAQQKMADWLLLRVPWRTTGATEEKILAAEAARAKLRYSQTLLAALNRANRGERVPTQTVNSIARAYPTEVQSLATIIRRKQAGENVASDVRDLRNTAKGLVSTNQLEYARAVDARAREREAAIRPHYGEGEVAIPAFGGKIFTGVEAQQTVETLRKTFEPSFSKALGEVNKANAVTRYFMLAGDVSWPMIQLIMQFGSNPVTYSKAVAGGIRSIFDSKFHARQLSLNKALIDKHRDLLISGQSEFTEAFNKGGWLSGDIRFKPEGEKWAKTMALLVPRLVTKVASRVLRPWQKGFEAGLDLAGIYLAQAHDYLATTPEATADVDLFINEFRGLFSSSRIGITPKQRQVESMSTLAPMYLRAIASILLDTTRGTIRGSLARKSLIKGAFALVIMNILISMARGEDKDEIIDHLNPTSSNFFTWDVAGQKIGPGSKFRSIIRLIAQSAENPDDLIKLSMQNPALRFVRGNLAPVVGSGLDLLTGRNYIGDPTRDGILTFSKEILAGNLLPIWVQSVLLEGGSPGGRTVRGVTEFLGWRAYPEPLYDEVGELRDKYAQQDFTLDYAKLTREQTDQLSLNHPDLKELEQKAELEAVSRGDEFDKWFYNYRKAITEQRNKELDEAAALLLNGTITKYDYDKLRGYERPYYSGGTAALYSARDALKPEVVKDINSWLADNQKPEDEALDAYQEYRANLIDQADLPTDWDTIESQCNQFLARYSKTIQEYVLRNLNRWINDLPESAKQVELMRLAGIEDETWWDNYRGAGTSGSLWSGYLGGSATTSGSIWSKYTK